MSNMDQHTQVVCSNLLSIIKGNNWKIVVVFKVVWNAVEDETWNVSNKGGCLKTFDNPLMFKYFRISLHKCRLELV